MRASDPPLARVIDAVGPFRMKFRRPRASSSRSPKSIVYQQLSGKAAATIFARVCALFPRARTGLRPEAILRTSDATLRGAGLSRPKQLALRDLASRTQSGEIPPLAALRRMEDAAIVESLTQVRGIGRWTAEMFLMFRLGRPDVLPAEDYGVRKGFASVYHKRKLPVPSAARETRRTLEALPQRRELVSVARARAGEDVAHGRAARRPRTPSSRRPVRGAASRKLPFTAPWFLAPMGGVTSCAFGISCFLAIRRRARRRVHRVRARIRRPCATAHLAPPPRARSASRRRSACN